ncbi:hypothetical protein EHS25_001589 [Saitozyma podzolica]|uniref:Xylanolytic transcriptional activator regulatory domain-containing protein n=1 Tax=Saitozyma podzolica TaxID=1890683 RepID=A0A427YGG1_9TREE|nr:hypothetical protein EHS25_001589 [Saitozyma podzolica]
MSAGHGPYLGFAPQDDNPNESPERRGGGRRWFGGKHRGPESEAAEKAEPVLRRLSRPQSEMRPEPARRRSATLPASGDLLGLRAFWYPVYLPLQAGKERPDSIRPNNKRRSIRLVEPSPSSSEEPLDDPNAWSTGSGSRNEIPLYGDDQAEPSMTCADGSRNLSVAANEVDTWEGNARLDGPATATRMAMDNGLGMEVMPPGPRRSQISTSNQANHDALNTASLFTSRRPLPFRIGLPHTTNPLESILPRDLLVRIIDLYFKYLHGLLPCLHKPTFLRDLHERREERPAEEEWVALVFVSVAVTLCQIPRALVRLSGEEANELITVCYAYVRTYLEQPFLEVTVTRLIVLYLHVAYTLGFPNAARAHYGANYSLSLTLGLHEEKSYDTLDPIERELRRRVFWLQYGGDKTDATVSGYPVHWHEADCAGVALPSLIDDDFITEQGYLEQPADVTPKVSGFFYISKLFRYAGVLIDKRQRDRLHPPTGILLQMRLNEIDLLYDEVTALMENCPLPLRLNTRSDSGPANGWNADASADASADVRAFFLNPSYDRQSIDDGFLVQQANIYVTQQMIRYAALEYRAQLAKRLTDEVSQQIGQHNGVFHSLPRNESAWNTQQQAVSLKTERERVTKALLTILAALPIQAIAINGGSLAVKVRYIASYLLNALPAAPGASEDVQLSSERLQAQKYLWNYLKILCEIETFLTS